jgi:UDP-3-O-[3-hydroxymyristoyl] N-acetylglucosamine deacetylase
MDGLPTHASLAQPYRQRTLDRAIGCVGVGLHSGVRIQLELRPAPAGTGIVFRRSDLGSDIPARFDNVADTRLCTLLAADGAEIGTVEHVMAALAACRVDNAVVAVDGAEIPVLDGSAAEFVFLIGCAGVAEQDAPPRIIEVTKTVRVSEGLAFAELRPALGGGLDMSVSIDFAAAAIGRQALSLQVTEASFRQQLAFARTFALAEDIAGLKEAGLAQGGSLDNAVVVDGERVLNPSGLRARDEFVRHKMLDAVGDLALAGARLHARFVAHRPGHALNNRLLRALFADRDAWTWHDEPEHGRWGGVPLAAAAAPVR